MTNYLSYEIEAERLRKCYSICPFDLYCALDINTIHYIKSTTNAIHPRRKHNYLHQILPSSPIFLVRVAPLLRLNLANEVEFFTHQLLGLVSNMDLVQEASQG